MSDNLMSAGIAIDRLRDHYKHCIRLSASNKINPKNAFDLQLIDIMQDLVSITDDGQMNFKIASSALDVGAKIYSNRVDRIQSEAQKVASSILSALDGQTSNENEDDSNQDGNMSAGSDRMNGSNTEEGKANTKKKRPTRSKNVKTVEKDENLSETKIEKMIVGDVFFDNLSQDYDMSCPAALIDYSPLTQQTCLLTIESKNLRKNYSDIDNSSSQSPAPSKCNLSTVPEEDTSLDETVCENDESKENETDQDGDTIMKDEKDQASPNEKPMTTQQSTINVNLFSISTNSRESHNLVTLMAKNTNCAKIIRAYKNEHISPRLDNFLFNDRSTTIAGLNNQFDESKVFAEPQQNLNMNSSMTMGGAHQFIPETYDNNNDDDGDDHFADAESHFGDHNDRNENDGIPDLNKIAAAKPTEYGYSTEQHRLLNAWAGPHNWKAMKAPLTVKKDGAPKSARKRAKLELSPIRFGEAFDNDLQKLANKDIRFSADVIKRWKKPLLPQDHNLDEDAIRTTLNSTFLRPEDTYHCLKTPADAAKIVDADHDYVRDGTPASPEQAGFDVHDDSDDEFWADPVVEGNEVAIYGAQINDSLIQQDDLEFAGENLIEQPYTVAHINIPFAKAAKKMDVRKLKRVMWDLLFPPEKRLNVTVIENGLKDKSMENGNSTVSSGGDDNGNETVILKENGDSGTIKKQEGNKFGDTSIDPSELPVHLEFSSLYGELPVRVSSKMANDLSQPIAFVTLLHLANEKNLKLIPNEDLKDFVIEQD